MARKHPLFHGQDFSDVIIKSANGIVVPPNGSLKRMKAFFGARGMLLIFDEAQTGLARVGANFAFGMEDVVPDFIALSKTLGAGVPLPATATSDAIDADGRVKKYSFYTSPVSDPMPAEVGLALIRLITTGHLAQRAKGLGDYLMSSLADLRQRYETIGDVRGRGLLVGVELLRDRHSRQPAHELMQGVTNRCLQLGSNIGKAGGPNAVWRIAPPLTIERSELDSAVGILDTALKKSGAH